ncbi:ATP-dependent DNA helicase [Macrolepiota fuliginosa MF-IS2]|uniref:ATP-dependent DNA helicase n=1 Tax=Macrolepiota fuliginosa MF-IS2 TaxID=1400762 RepID=A0A9P6C070_9AGAR|nr:ATP-dependent DNA helicase [Macrolepiota fuliginosa MF-IS2]
MAQWARKQELKRRIAEVDADISGLKESIKSLSTQLHSKEDQKEGMLRMLQDLERVSEPSTLRSDAVGGKKGGRVQQGINYMDGNFDWMAGLKARMKSVFGISDFRLCQRGICNANMDGRDVVVVMPTGGGKSLTYQLPALFTPGCTLVVSPLISLITDQILHLQANGIKAVALTGSTPSQDKKAIQRQLIALSEGRLGPGEEEIKLCYVTPEKLAKDKGFVAMLHKLVTASKLARIVIDEAHCVSQMGHDFRPDYQKLHMLRQLFPSVPIMALSATCPPLVLKDLLKTLRLPDIVDGRNAKASGTVYFFAPLYRKNLHYRVAPKPSKATEVTKAMVDYILEHHLNDSGIVYCLSKKNTETVAQELQELSGGKIKTGVYHADRQDREKSQLHTAWREGKIKVVCATIAFGLGIDKGDVRFVLHHSKSLEGYYQESGRAGRDGKDADCVLFYRPQDGSTISSMVASEKCGQEKLHAVLDFAEDLEECRKIQFAKYFSHSSNLSISSWTTEDQDALERCGHCDNCSRAPDSVEHKDVTIHSWQLLKIAQYVQSTGGNATVNMLAGLARSASGGAFEVPAGGGGRGKKKEKEKVSLDLDDIAGGVVDLPKDHIEHLIVRLLIKGYFKEEYHQTSYSTNVYVVPGRLAARLIHESREGILKAARPMVEMTFAKQTPKTRGRRKKNIEDAEEDGDITPPAKKRKTAVSGKGKEKENADPDEVEVDNEFDHMYVDNPRPRKNQTSRPATQKKANTRGDDEEGEYETIEVDIIENTSDEDSDVVTYGWSRSLREEPTARRKQKTKVGNVTMLPSSDEILVLSD